VPALYASFEPSTVRAEMVRTAELQGDPEAAIYPVRLAEIAVDAETAELIDPGLLHNLGVQIPVSVLTPRSETQRVGAAAIRLGIEALVIPSVAVRADNVVIFPDNLAAEVEVVQERRVSTPGRWP
jgi:hypothetical protein